MPTVLLIDDDADLRSALRATLAHGGLEVLEAASGQEALAALTDRPDTDAIVSDVQLPAVDGVTLYDLIIQAHPRLAGRVIFLTGAAGNPAVHRSIEARDVPLLSKSGDPRLVIDALRLILLPGRTTGST
ncbi:MAG TPA: response regulator [Gemmatimonadales bacterium]|nr:response regulator [Gemmatimonadales bacterium]